ncbi:MAG: MBL fold metallo-hydrolase [Bacteroidia bacterium]|nr:MBL fold metallo-hydrolase [Bacteroidia bacterium]
MKTKLIIISLLAAFSLMDAPAQTSSSTLTQDEINAMNAAIRADSNLSTVIGWYGKPIDVYEKYKINLVRADSIWKHDQQTIKKIKNIGTTKHFEMIPLIDWFTSGDSLTGESGVSYLIKTDEATILFDLGDNTGDENPSPLLRNMRRLGIKPEDIDIIFISHNHGDHVGGTKWEEKNTFSLTNYQLPLKPIPVYTPVEMTYPGLAPVYTPLPVKIAKGVATIGVIHNPIFVTDIEEQALAINVENKGIVIISGCGHQSIKKIIQRTQLLFDEHLYGILGGLHFPMEEGRNITWLYKYYVVGKLPWERLTVEDIMKNCEVLKAANVKLVGLSGHDSSDKSISIFRQEFRGSFVDIKVGEKISLN